VFDSSAAIQRSRNSGRRKGLATAHIFVSAPDPIKA
jgi:hypothetical protein